MTEGQRIYFESPEEAEAREVAFRAFMQPGRKVPVLWEDGVSTWEVVAVQEDGTMEFRTAP